MTQTTAELPALGLLLVRQFGDRVLKAFVDRGRLIVEIRREALLDLLRFLKTDERAECTMFIDCYGIDYLEYPGEHVERFAVCYQLRSLRHGHTLTVRAWVSESDPRCPSGLSIFQGCKWTEREIFDMFGIVFDGAPDMRRILMPEDFDEGHPLRKDYPLRGKGWRDNFEVYPGYEPKPPTEFNRPPPGVYDR